MFYGAEVNDWRQSRSIAGFAVVLFLLVQVGIPLTRLGEGDRTLRFGWQMFTAAEEAPEFVVVTPDDQIEIELLDYLARARADIDIVGSMPAHLCTVFPEAVLVTWQSGEFTC